MTTEQTLERIETILERIAQALENQTTHQYQYTPEGNPICPRHNVPMRKREKQGDTWYSHTITDPVTGESLYCRGYASKNSPGWNIIENSQPPVETQYIASPQHLASPARQAPQPRHQQPASPIQNPKSKIQNPPSTIQNSPNLASAIRELKGGRQ